MSRSGGSDPPVFGGVNQGMMDAPLFQGMGGRGRGGGNRRRGRGGRSGGGGGGHKGPSTPPDIEPPAPGTDTSGPKPLMSLDFVVGGENPQGDGGGGGEGGDGNGGGGNRSNQGGGKGGGGGGGSGRGGKRKFQYFCELCNAKTTGEENFKVHLQGTRHMTNLKNKETGDPLILEKINYPNLKKRKGPGDLSEPAAVRDKIAACEDPLIGIEYLLEFVREDDPDDVYYVCEMCKCRLSPGSVMPHLTGSRHGVAYVKKHHPEMAKGLDRVPGKEDGGEGWKRSNISSVLKDIAREIESKAGRQTLKSTLVPGSKPAVPSDRNSGWVKSERKPERRQRRGPPNLLEMEMGVPGGPDFGPGDPDRDPMGGPGMGPGMGGPDMGPGMRGPDMRPDMGEPDMGLPGRDGRGMRGLDGPLDMRDIEFGGPNRRGRHFDGPDMREMGGPIDRGRDFDIRDREFGRPGMRDRDFGEPGMRDRDFGEPGMRDRDFGGPGMRDRDFGGQGMRDRDFGGPDMRDRDLGGPGMRDRDLDRPDLRDRDFGRRDRDFGGPDRGFGGPERMSMDDRERDMGGRDMVGREMGGRDMPSRDFDRGIDMHDRELLAGRGGGLDVGRGQVMAGGPGMGNGGAGMGGGGPGMGGGLDMGGAPSMVGGGIAGMGAGGMQGMGAGDVPGMGAGGVPGMGAGGVAGMGAGVAGMGAGVAGMGAGVAGMGAGVAGMGAGVAGMGAGGVPGMGVGGVPGIGGGGMAGMGVAGALGMVGGGTPGVGAGSGMGVGPGMGQSALAAQGIGATPNVSGMDNYTWQQMQQYPYDQTMYENYVAASAASTTAAATAGFDSSSLTAAQLGLGMVASSSADQMTQSAATWAAVQAQSNMTKAGGKKKSSLDDYLRNSLDKAGKSSKPLTEDTEEDLRLRCSDAFILRECERRFHKRISPRDGSVSTIGEKGDKQSKADGKVVPDKSSAAPPIPSLDTNTVKNLLTELSQSMVKNEEDASMALQVSNALTQALLNYRIKHMPAEMAQ